MFYQIQEKLRPKGWYVEWWYGSYQQHIFEDLPFEHEDGPLKDTELEPNKIMVVCTGDDTENFADDIAPDEGYDWIECVTHFLSCSDQVNLDKFIKENPLNIPLPTPEGWNGCECVIVDDELVREEVVPVLKELGCRYVVNGDSLYIEWGPRENVKYPRKQEFSNRLKW